MAIRDIVTLPELVLRKKARKVSDFGPELQLLIDDMIETMRAAPGVGLAATQVGVSQQVIVVEYQEESDEQSPPKLYVLINPEISRFSKDTELATEGCLSVPEVLGEVKRHLEVTIKGLNRHGKPVRVKARGWLARIFQHELDHLNGILFVDRAERVWKAEGEPTQVAAS